MVAIAACGSAGSGSTLTDSTRMRGSHCASSRVMRSWIERRVLTVFGSKRKRPRLPPNLGALNLSGCSVMRITRIDSRTFVSPSDHATRPSGPTRGGKLIPRPNISPAFIFVPFAPFEYSCFCLQLRYRKTEQEKRYPPENDVEQ